MISENRLMVLRAVLAGQIGSEHVTLEELTELQVNAGELVMDVIMERAADRGCSVFAGVECHSLN
jgi:predicted urease superfamily metal-dependent hydrolase